MNLREKSNICSTMLKIEKDINIRYDISMKLREKESICSTILRGSVYTLYDRSMNLREKENIEAKYAEAE